MLQPDAANYWTPKKYECSIYFPRRRLEKVAIAKYNLLHCLISTARQHTSLRLALLLGLLVKTFSFIRGISRES